MKLNGNKRDFKLFLITIGGLGLVLGFQGLLSEHIGAPNFYGRWGWFYELLYIIFGKNGEFYFMILFGIYSIYYSIFVLK